MSVRVLGTGGTIAAHLDNGVLRLLPIAEVAKDLSPGLPAWDAIDLESIPSSALRPQDMLGIARRACQALRDGAEGVVITHGTDTLEETAFLTDLLLGNDSELGGVVFTGAMRFASHESPDGPANLADAIRLAASPGARGLGTLVSFAGDIFSAYSATKATTSSLNPFTSPDRPIGRISGDQIEIDVAPSPRWASSLDAETNVVLVKAYPGMLATGLEALISEGIRGVVIEGFGVLNVPETLLPAIRSAIDQGVAVIVGSRAFTPGGLDQGPLGHRLLHDIGAVGTYGLAPNKAWVALMVGLASTDGSPTELREWLQTIHVVQPATIRTS